jgi:hypothetical protein
VRRPERRAHWERAPVGKGGTRRYRALLRLKVPSASSRTLVANRVAAVQPDRESSVDDPNPTW